MMSKRFSTIYFFNCSGHPLAMAAGLATLEVYEEQGLFENAETLAPYWEAGLHSLKGLPNVIDIRNYGLMGAVEVTPIAGLPAKRALDIFDRCWEKGLFIRVTGSTAAFSPPLICTKAHIDRIVNTLAEAIVESSKELA